MTNNKQLASLKLFFDLIYSYPFNCIRYLKRKKVLHITLLSILLMIIISFIFIIIHLSIAIFKANTSISDSTSLLSSQERKANQLEASISSLKNKIELLTVINKDLEYNLTTSEYINPILSNEINHLSNKVSPFYHHFLSLVNASSIIEGVDEVMMLFKWIPLSEETPINKLQISLLYKGSRDSDDKTVFHSLCDNRAPFMVLFKARGKVLNAETNQTAEVTIRFGAISNAMIQSNKQFIKVIDNGLVLFSLDNGATYKISRSYSGLYTGSDMLINLGFVVYLVDDWRLQPDKLYLSIPYSTKSSSLYKDNPWPYQDQYYTAEEVELFHISTNYTKE